MIKINNLTEQLFFYRDDIKNNKGNDINFKYKKFEILNNGMFLRKTDEKGIKYLFINKYIYHILGFWDDLPHHDVCFVIKIKSYIIKKEDILECNRIILEYNKK